MADTTETAEKSSKPQEHLDGRKDLMRALGVCLIAVVIVRSFIFEPFKIPSSSMIPTLRIGDHIFVSKFNFGLSVPFTKFEFLRLGTPKRGDVIVFLSPRDESLHYIKRVVGIPGDTIEFKGRDIFINGELVKKESVTDSLIVNQVTGTDVVSGDLFREELGGTHYVKYSHGVADTGSRYNQVEVVPPDKFFVVGDNRDDSYDSRSWGYVPRENIKGRAIMIWLSLDAETAWGRWDKVRWGRCGTLIH